MHLRMDGDTGAMFAADRITHEEAVVSVISTPRGGDTTRSDRAAVFLREWLDQLPAAVTRVTTWASDAAASAFLRAAGFQDQGGYVTPEGGRGMTLAR